MKPEIEAKFLRANHAALRAKLKELGAECVQQNRLMKRKNYDFPDKRLGKKHAWARVRDEAGKITLSYKQLDDRSLQGMKEICLTVDSFEAADELLQALGLRAYNFQESKRESWRLNGLEIELDEWPWIEPFLEIEGPDEKSVRDMSDLLGLDWTMATFGSIEIGYRQVYDVTEAEVNGWPEITFGPVPNWLETKRKTTT